MTPRAVLYLRLSSADDSSTSIARQEADLRARADREGWDVAAVFADDGVSGAKARANADDALSMLREGRAEVLLVWKFDRWSRQGLGALAALIEVLDDRPNAVFVADRDGLSSTQPAWRIIASVLAEVARMERDNTRTRVLSSLAALRTSGRYAGGQRPYGYVSAPNPDGPGRVLVIEPSEAEVVREAARRVLDGETPYAVAHDLNARGIPAKQGGRWSPTVLRDLLQRDSIVGRVLHRGEIVRDSGGMPVTVWEPLLDVETWHALRVHLGAIGRDPSVSRRRHAPRLLAGIIRCAGCGSPMYLRASKAQIDSYQCAKNSAGRECPGVAINARLVEAHVEERFLTAVGDLEVHRREEEESTDAATLADIDRALAETATALAEDDADLVFLLDRLASLKARRAAVRASSGARSGIRYVGTGQTFRDVWEASTVVERRDLLAANVAVLSIAKGRRGVKGLDASRVTLVAQPAHPLGEHPSSTPARPASN